MNTRRITGVAAGCAIAVATVLGAQIVDDQQGHTKGQRDHQPGVVRPYGAHDEATVYQWWQKVEREGPDSA